MAPPRVPALNLRKLNGNAVSANEIPYSHEYDAAHWAPGAGWPGTPSPRVKHVTRQYSSGSIVSARGISGKLMSGIAAMSPRRKGGDSPRGSGSTITTPRGAIDPHQRTGLSDSPAVGTDPPDSKAGPLEKAARDAPSGMSREQLEEELLRARTDLMVSRKVRDAGPATKP